VVVETADSGAKGLALAEQRRPDLLIVDMFLPDVTGLGFCRSLREHPELGSTPIIIVSGHASEVDRVLAFELGADDYLPAPFFERELASRARAVLRRSSGRRRPARPTPRPVERGELVYDPEAGSVSVGGQVIDLTRTELEIVGLLIREEGRVLSRRQILGRLGEGTSQANERTVDAHVKALRRKLRDSRGCIETVRGSGYRFAGEREAGSA
jgi:DNA-binding response OmpR family regulator